MDPVNLIGQGLAAGGLTGARPALTLLIIQAYAAFIANPAPVLPDSMGWIISPYALAVVGALSIAEHFARTDAEFEEMMEIPNKAISVVGAVLTAGLIVSLGGDPNVWDIQNTSTASTTLYTAGPSDALLGWPGLTIALSIIASMTLSWFRARLLSLFDAMNLPSAWWRWTETGTIASASLAIVFLPILGVVIAFLLIAGSIGGGLSIRAWEKRRDAQARIPCTSCGHNARQEASLCPKCGQSLTPQVRLTA